MYHISNYGFADPNYMEHYGVKGMRWRKRRPRYGIDARRYLDKGKDDIAGRMARGGPSGNPGPEYRSYLADTQKPIRNPLTTDRREYSKNRKNRSRPGMYNESGSIKGSRKVGGGEQGHNPGGLMSVRRVYQNLDSLQNLGSVKSLSNNKVDDLKNKIRPLRGTGVLQGSNNDPLDVNRRRRRR